MSWNCLFVSTAILATSMCHCAPKWNWCRDVDGMKIPEGANYMPTTDPCMKCTCNNGEPIACLSIVCAAPNCPAFEQIPRKCCEYTCLDLDDGSPKHLRDITGQCIDRNGMVIQNGTQFVPMETDPCLMCTCIAGAAQDCMTTSCVPPSDCPWEQVDGECCSFRCMDKCEDDLGNEAKHGEPYTPHTAQPCTQCICDDGRPKRCATAICDAPNCRRYEQIEGVCCGFKCLEDVGCVSNNGTIFPHGEPYLPYVDDACTLCLCDNGSAGACMAIHCIPPVCAKFKTIEGTCCEFKCLSDEDTGEEWHRQ